MKQHPLSWKRHGSRSLQMSRRLMRSWSSSLGGLEPIVSNDSPLMIVSWQKRQRPGRALRNRGGTCQGRGGVCRIQTVQGRISVEGVFLVLSTLCCLDEQEVAFTSSGILHYCTVFISVEKRRKFNNKMQPVSSLTSHPQFSLSAQRGCFLQKDSRPKSWNIV